MELQLESLKYQDTAIQSVVKVFDGTEKNTFDNATFEGIRANVCKLTTEQLNENAKNVLLENGIDEETARLSTDNDLCIEMETGTGKTLVYLKTIYELYKHYGFTKFIILVPSVAIRQGVLSASQIFEKQLENIYGFTPKLFEYDSKKLNKVTNFIEEQHPQVMVMTLASFNSEDKILNQAQREDLFANIPFIDAIGKTNPIIIMDEPQEGMDTDNSVKQIAKLNPLFKLRYSATHKTMKNLIYRLTPYDSYKQGLVKKIEVLTVSEKNDEATIKIELTETQNGTSAPKAKVKAWKLKGGKFVFEETNWLKVGDNLGEKTNNPSYLNYQVARINKSLRTGKWSIEFSNGVILEEKQSSGNLQSIWALQLEWLILRHFQKSQKLAEQGIKCLSLIFIDRVANYIGENPIIKNLFVEKYKQVYAEFNGSQPTDEYINQIQGYYFAQKGSGEFADNEGGQKEQKKIYELILKGKEELLNINNPVQFIFSHSALGVGWDNPNVFNIATLNTAYSEVRKRQEIGRGLRICVNQDGQRIYDALDTNDTERINQLTVIPNETYETFVTQYQEEIKEVYGTTSAGAGMSHTHKGKPQNEVHFKRNQNETVDTAFKRFWKSLSKKTNYTTAFDETNLVTKATEEINKINIADYVAEVSSRSIGEISEEGIKDNFGGTETYNLKAYFTPLDLVEELSENTGMSYNTLFEITKQIKNHEQFVKNPPQYIHQAAAIIRNIELDEMIRGLDYHLTGEEFPFLFDDFVRNLTAEAYVETPNKGVFDKMLVDSFVEKTFAKSADVDDEIVCFLKLPSYYKIKTPIGEYEPDFGLVMKRKSLKTGNENEFYFVVETKGTNDLNDKKALTESEAYRIRCAVKHFEALGVEVHYKAPVKEYSYFRTEAAKTINSKIEQA
ncbi:MAG: DEAD/DEAH box helicase family protein [Bacteroidia bacterium]|nr:DEAD/DEAH box helicase family protein [Bacteroidia bacterium]